MNPQLFQQPFFSVALPIMATLVIAAWNQNKPLDDTNKRLDDMRGDTNRRLDDVIARLGRIEAKIENHDERIVRVEERTSAIGRSRR